MVECPICLRDLPVPSDAREGDLIFCPYCKTSFQLVRVDGQWSGERVEHQEAR